MNEQQLLVLVVCKLKSIMSHSAYQIQVGSMRAVESFLFSGQSEEVVVTAQDGERHWSTVVPRLDALTQQLLHVAR